MDSEPIDCPVCLEPIPTALLIPICTNKHTVCEMCADKVLETRKCPLCRAAIGTSPPPPSSHSTAEFDAWIDDVFHQLHARRLENRVIDAVLIHDVTEVHYVWPTSELPYPYPESANSQRKTLLRQARESHFQRDAATRAQRQQQQQRREHKRK